MGTYPVQQALCLRKRTLKETSDSLRTGTGGELKKRRFGEPAAPPIFSVEPPGWQELIARKARTASRTATAAKLPSGFPLRMLPEELQLIVAEHVAAPRDRAALCVAVPPLGRKAIKAIPAYQGPLMSLGNRVLSGGALSEAEVRRYVREFSPWYVRDFAPYAYPYPEHSSLALKEWAQLNAIAAPSARVRCGCVCVRTHHVHPHPEWSNHLEWRLESGALLRSWQPFAGVRNSMYTCLHVYCTRGTPGVHHYEGAAGAERLVALAFADGHVHGFVGERGAELVCQDCV